MEALKTARSEADSQNQELHSLQTTDSPPQLDSSPVRDIDIPSSLPSALKKQAAPRSSVIDNSKPSQHSITPLGEVPPAALPQEATAPTNSQIIDLAASSPPAHHSDSLSTTPHRDSKVAEERKRRFEDYDDIDEEEVGEEEDSQRTEQSFSSRLSTHHSRARHEAYYQMLEDRGEGEWDGGFSLLSTDGHHSTKEKEL